MKSDINGTRTKDILLFSKILDRLEHARKQHKWGKKYSTNSPSKAHEALKAEIGEWLQAIDCETPERQLDEALDIIAVAIRIAHQEYRS